MATDKSTVPSDVNRNGCGQLINSLCWSRMALAVITSMTLDCEEVVYRAVKGDEWDNRVHGKECSTGSLFHNYYVVMGVIDERSHRNPIRDKNYHVRT